VSTTALAPGLLRRHRGTRVGLNRWHAVAAVALLLGFAGWRMVMAPAPGHRVDSAAVEAVWGIRLTQIGVTADGGLVDVRYQVTDSDKAADFLETVENLPVLIAEDSGVVVRSAAMMANGHHDVEPGRTYFLLYRNTDGAIRPGTSVSVVFDDLRLEHLIAQ
jgi:hypothetical protein